MASVRLALPLCVLLLGACANTAEYVPPTPTLSPAFAHAPLTDTNTPWPSAEWWRGYADPELARLMREVGEANPELGQAEARWRQALALVDAAAALGRPQVAAGAAIARGGNSRGTTGAPTTASAGLEVAWAPDLWGRVADRRAAAQADAQAQAVLIDATRLALRLAAAQGYVRLRAIDAQIALQSRTEVAYARSLRLTQDQYGAGLVARADVIQAETQLQSLRTDVFVLRRQRALEANALATFAGRVPGDHRVAPLDSAAAALPPLPGVPSAMPGDLLRRRPDLVAVERQLAASHARWGVAQRAWLPDLTLSASGSLQAGSVARLLEAPARVWSLGPQLAATLFDGGTRRAAEAQALAVYDEQAGVWRASVLTAVREVEDALAQLQHLADQEREQRRLVELATENERVVGFRYEGGEITFLEVATAQTLALTAQRALVDVQANRLIASLSLVAALGGGWNGADVDPASRPR